MNETLNNAIKSLNNAIDEKIKEACLIWGVDVNNHEEIKRRCSIIDDIPRKRKELIIDDHLVMVFTDWEIDSPDFKVGKVTFGASFKCSEILKPL